MKRGFWAVLLLIALLAKVSCQENGSGSGSNPEKSGDNDKSSSNDDTSKEKDSKDDSSSNGRKKSKNGVSAMAFSGLLLFVSSMLFSLQ